MIIPRILIIIVVLLFSLACSPNASHSQHLHHAQFFAFGTTIDLSIYGVDETLAQKAKKTAQQDFEYMHRAWHPYESGPLRRINSLLPMQHAFSFAPSVRDLILEAKKYDELSDHYFNPAIGKLIQLWGFHQPETLEGKKPPSADAIKALVANTATMSDVKIDGLQMSTQHENVALDFGGVAKGFGVDRAIQELQKLGIENIIVNAGGDLRAIGSKGGKPWVIGIRHPRNNGIVASLKISGDESVFTSGDYERYFTHGGKRYNHILSPFTGYPADDFQSVTVVTQNAALADAAATAISVAGRDHWQRIAKKMQLQQLMLIDQSGQITITEALHKRIEFIGVDEAKIKVVTL